MEVILLERIGKLGNIGDVVAVKNGYARNYLLPRAKALRANEANKAAFEVRKAEIEQRDKEAKKSAEKQIASLPNSLTIIRQASEEGRLFGSVNSRDIVALLKEEGVELNKSNIIIGSTIKNTGIYKVGISLHADVSTTILVNVARSEEEASVAMRKEEKSSEEANKEDSENH
jgi:large subunit ribosomal protein L9